MSSEAQNARASELRRFENTKRLEDPIDELKPEAKELLAGYVKLPEEDMLEHVNKMARGMATLL